jgi:23S rRNA (cytidine1920-2'-O)/16S rRNA (cytidine1409-2'-O)-methyltransferase
MTERQRADLLLVERGFFESRAKAQAAIAAGLVRANGKIVAKPSENLLRDAAIEAEPAFPFVSRGGVKLEAALSAFGFDLKGRLCIDIGASTGGFTDAMLRHGAARVIAVDVGREQLHPSLRADPRVESHEGTDIRTFAIDGPLPDFASVDVSFIGLEAILSPLVNLLAPRCEAVLLVKPQFEVGRAQIGKGGIVKDEAAVLAVLDRIGAAMSALNFEVLGIIASPIAGGDGNQEFLLGARRVETA